MKQPRSYDDMGSAGIQIPAGILEVHAPPDLQTAGVGRKCSKCRRLVARPQHDDVAAGQTVPPIEFGIPGSGAFGDEVCPKLRWIVSQCAADDLFHSAFMDVNARSKHRRQGQLSRRDTASAQQRYLRLRRQVPAPRPATGMRHEHNRPIL